MTDFKAKMHQNRFRLGLCPRPRWECLQRSPDPLVGFGGRFAAGEGAGLGKRRGRGGSWGSGGEGSKGRDPKLLLNQGPSVTCYATAFHCPNLVNLIWALDSGQVYRRPRWQYYYKQVTSKLCRSFSNDEGQDKITLTENTLYWVRLTLAHWGLLM